ncbi:MAG TPA: YwiC-like family protein [Blastocatellia bacterium]|nr:YwiC-like family protein [Blastocatellia bacterium]
MITPTHTRDTTGPVRIRPIALPVEHGGWGLLLEPIVLGLLLVPSAGGSLIATGALAAFLVRQPLKLAIGDRRRGRRVSRTVIAERFVLLYSGVAVICLAGAVKTARPAFLLPLLVVAPIALIQLLADSVGRGRTLVAELAGSIWIGAVATAIALAGGWPGPAALGLWAILAARAAPAILYLRTRLRLSHHKPASPRVVVVAHLAAILVAIELARAGLAPFLGIAAMVILLIRAVIGFSSAGARTPAKTLGLWEVGFGAMTVFAVILGHSIGC